MKTLKFVAKEAASLAAFMIGTAAVTIYFDNKAKEARTHEESR